MLVSVVIPTYNREEYLKHTLESVSTIDFNSQDFEIICVDDGSTDGTKDFLKEYCKNHINVRYFIRSHRGASAARNLGIEKAKGEIIAFTDSDCIVDKNWLKEIIESFKEKEVVGVAGRVTSIPENITPFTHQIINQGDLFAGCNIACGLDALVKVRKFDENFRYGHEDTDLYFRLKKLGKVVYNPNAIVCHPPIKLSFLQFVKRMKTSYECECLLYRKYPEAYKSRSLLCSIIRLLGIKSFVKSATQHIRWLYRNPFIYILYFMALVLQRFYLLFLIGKGFHKNPKR